MKVMLIQPSIRIRRNEVFGVTPPLGLGYLAAVAEENNHKVKILDSLVEGYHNKRNWDEEGYGYLGLNKKEMYHRIESFKPDVVGITVPFTLMYQNALEAAFAVKEFDQDVPVMVGGTHVSADPESILKNDNIDYAIIGEGEKTFKELINYFEKDLEINSIQGVAYKINNGEVNVNTHREYITDLDSIPFPARHLMDTEEYIKISESHGPLNRKRYTPMITSRGCPGRCIFCSIHCVWGYKWRSRSVENILEEIEQVIQRYNVKEIHFEDDNISLNRERMKKICEAIIERGLDITWTVPNGIFVNTLDRELLKLMRDSGCYQLNLGIESGNENIRKNVIGKHISTEKIKKVVKEGKKQGIWMHGFFIIGLPEETIREIEDTLKFSREINLDSANFFIATPYPGTELYKTAVSQGYIKDMDYEKLRTMDAILSTENFDPNKLLKLQKRAYKEFTQNLIKREINPINLVRRLSNIRSRDDLSFYYRKGKRLLNIFK